MLITEIEIDSRGKRRIVSSPQLALPLRSLPGCSQPGSLRQPMRNPAGTLAVLSPTPALGWAVRRAAQSVAGSALPPSAAKPALRL